MVEGEETAAPEKTEAQQAMEFLQRDLEASRPSALEEDMRSEGIDVVRHEKPVEAPAEPVEDEGLETLAEALAEPATDPRQLWRDQAQRDAVQFGGMDEDSARVYVNSAKKGVVEKQLEAWKSRGVQPQSVQPPSGQDTDPLSAPGSDPDPAATSIGQDVDLSRTESPVGSELEAVRAEMQQLRQALLADKVAAHRAALADAGKELRDEFPRIVTDDGRLDDKVREAAQVLFQLPAFKGASQKDLLRAAAAAAFSVPQAGADNPASSRPRTPVADVPQATGRPQSREEWADAFHRIRAKYGDPGNLSASQAAEAQKAIDAYRRRHG